MKIFFLITGLGYGGAETQLLYVTSELKKLGHTCLVCSMTKPVEISDKFKDNGISVVSLDMIKGQASLGALLHLRSIIKNFKPDIVHSHMIHANIMARVIRLSCKFKLINTAHNVYEGGYILENILKYSDFLVNYTTQVSPEGLNRYIENKIFKEHKSCFMKNAVKKPNFKNTLHRHDYCSDSDLLFLSIGRLEDVKDYPNLLAAINKITNKNVKFIIAGRGDLLDELKEMSVNLNIQHKVSFLGARADIEELISIADVFIMSSKYEGLPISLLESMAQGLPVISTSVGAIPDLVFNQTNGFLVEKENSNALAVAIDEMASLSVSERYAMGNYSCELINKNFSSEIIADEWVNIYNRLL